MPDFFPGLQTNFNARIDLGDLVEVYAGFDFRWARMDAQTCDIGTLHGMIADARSVGLTPLPIVYDLERLGALTGPLDVEWGNEPDGDILPESYRIRFDEACELAALRGLRLWGPAISNLDQDSLLWMARVLAVGGGRWDPGLHGISAHRYGDGTFAYAHRGFANRDEEVDALLDLCQGLPYIISEWGYPTTPVNEFRRRPKRAKYLRPDLHLTEDEQAANFRLEWDFWKRHGCRAPFVYQINDGTTADEGYGIRRCLPDGTLTDWKPSAYTVPEEGSVADLASVTANTVFHQEDLVEVPGRAGEYGLRCPPGTETILSPKTSGHHELRDMSALGGPDETCKVSGPLVYFPMNSQGGRFAWPLIKE